MRILGTPVFDRIVDRPERVICLRGGTRSSKSFSMIQVLTLWLFTGKLGAEFVYKGAFSVTRSTLPALRATIYKEFINYLHELGLYNYVAHLKTDREFHYNGREVVFFSLDDSHKLRGRQHTAIWYNEVTDIDFETFNQGAMRTTHKIYMDYNPSGDPFVRQRIEIDRFKEKKDVYIDVSVYTDNPFLSPLLVEEIKSLEQVDRDLFLIYTTGQWVTLKGLIYPVFTIVKEAPLAGKAYFGCDFGYNDPSVMVRVTIERDNLYIETLIYQRELLLDEMAAQMKKHVRPHEVVYCDSAEPRTIEELRRRGINAKPAKKGRDSVRQGIIFLRQHNIFVTEDSFETIKEFKSYKWAIDKDGRATDVPVNYAKHTSDACTYAITRAMTGKIKLI